MVEMEENECNPEIADSNCRQDIISTLSGPCTVLGHEDTAENKTGQVAALREVMFWLQVSGLHNCTDNDAID